MVLLLDLAWIAWVSFSQLFLSIGDIRLSFYLLFECVCCAALPFNTIIPDILLLFPYLFSLVLFAMGFALKKPDNAVGSAAPAIIIGLFVAFGGILFG